MSSELLASIAGITLSLLFSYIPGLSTWYATLTGQYKSLLMAGLLLVTAAAIFGLSCANVAAYVTCDQAGAISLVKIFIAALIANQATYAISPQTEGVKAIKADR
jgi:hypothetical protein